MRLPFFTIKPQPTRSPEEEALIRSLTKRIPPGVTSNTTRDLWQGRALSNHEFTSDPHSMSYQEESSQ